MIESIRIMGKTIRVFAQPHLMNERSARGEWHPRTLRIPMDPDSAPQQQAESILHEIIESLKPALAIELSHDDLTRLAEGLYAVLRDNPEVARHIVAGRRIVPKP